jgi:hypothetical protein
MDLVDLINWRLLSDEVIKNVFKNSLILIKGNQLDERDTFVSKQQLLTPQEVLVTYEPKTLKIKIEFIGFDDAPELNFEDPVQNTRALVDYLIKWNLPIGIDITSLTTASIFMLLRAFSENQFDNIFAFYVQPLDYIVERNVSVLPKYLFSEVLQPISSIPGFIKFPNEDMQSKLIVFLGFEGGRFHELCEHFLSEGFCEITPIIPMPSYSAGWHLKGLFSNLDTLETNEGFSRLKRITAWDPFHALAILEKQYNEYSDTHELIVAPLGTKPHILATALFIINHSDVRIMYDYPSTNTQSSYGIGKLRGYSLKGLLKKCN